VLEETDAIVIGDETPFTAHLLGDVSGMTGAAIETASRAGGMPLGGPREVRLKPDTTYYREMEALGS
jgi:hypothetical protein